MVEQETVSISVVCAQHQRETLPRQKRRLTLLRNNVAPSSLYHLYIQQPLLYSGEMLSTGAAVFEGCCVYLR